MHLPILTRSYIMEMKARATVVVDQKLEEREGARERDSEKRRIQAFYLLLNSTRTYIRLRKTDS